MHLIPLALCWLSLASRVVSSGQVPLGTKAARRYNVTLGFDDLHTNSSGIGFHPSSPSSASFAYQNLFFDSFTVKNVAKALPDLDSPIDIMCATSAPNALFGKRKPGYPWPHISLHDLALPFDHPRDNVTFNMKSITFSPTGTIEGENGKTLVQIQMTLMKLPTSESRPSEFPGIIHGEPAYSSGNGIYSIGYLWGPGSHQSVKLDFEQIREYYKGFAANVDVIETTAIVIRYNDKANRWEQDSDWEFCLDDVSIEVVDGDNGQEAYDFAQEQVARLTFRHVDEDMFVSAPELGEELMRDL